MNLAGEPELADVLPIPSQGDAIYDAVTDGILFYKMINNAVPGTIGLNRLVDS